MADDWSYRRAHEERRGVSLARLRELLSSGYIQPSDLVRGEDDDHWVSAGSLGELVVEADGKCVARTRVEIGGLIFDEPAPDGEAAMSEQRNGAGKDRFELAEPRESLVECLARSAVRTTTILDGTFADAVTIVQSRGECAVYQAAWDAMSAQSSGQSSNNGSTRRERRRRNMLFVSAGGREGVCQVAEFYRSMRLAVAVIVDLDIVLDQDALCRLIAPAPDRQIAATIVERARKVAERLWTTPAMLSIEREKQQLMQMLASLDDPDGRSAAVRKLLVSMSGELDASRLLKSGGVDCFGGDDELTEGLWSFIESCKPAGVFVVPVGGLGRWSPAMSAEEGVTPDRLRQAEDLMAFIADLADFHDAAAVDARVN